MRYVVFYESFQLADKVYYRTGRLSEDPQEMIKRVTGNDNYTKFIADVVHRYPFYTERNLEDIYDMLWEYNKNTFPISGFDDVNKVVDVSSKEIRDTDELDRIITGLKYRRELVKAFRSLPSIARRNLKEETRTPMTGWEMKMFNDRLGYLIAHIEYLSNRPEHIREKFYRKLFKKGQTLDEMIDMVEDKTTLIGGEYLTQGGIRQKCGVHGDLDLIYDQNKIMVIRVNGLDGILEIGKNSLWCFTYGRSHQDWDTFSTNGIVYVIFDFNLNKDDGEHMMVLVKPMEESDSDNGEFALYDMVNDGMETPKFYLRRMLKGEDLEKIFSFEI